MTASHSMSEESDVNYVLSTIELLRDELKRADLGMPEDETLIRLYTQLLLTTGEATTLEHVHDAWAVWRAFSDRPDNPFIVWFAELDAETRARDMPYVECIRRVAHQLARPAADPVS